MAGTRERRLAARRLQSIGSLHRRSTARAPFALDVNASAQPVAGPALDFGIGRRKTRSNNSISCSVGAADVVVSRPYPGFSGSSSEVFPAIASICRRCMLRSVKRVSYRTFPYSWTMVHSPSNLTHFGLGADTAPTEARGPGADGSSSALPFRTESLAPAVCWKSQAARSRHRDRGRRQVVRAATSIQPGFAFVGRRPPSAKRMK
jgi:hypothetical protein